MQTIKMAFKNVVSNKIMSFLTMLGIIFGVASFITMVAIGQGSTEEVNSQIGSLGTDILTVNITGSDVSFRENDADSLKDVNGVKEIAPTVSGRATVKKDQTVTQVALTGATSSYLDVRSLELQSGRFIADLDNENHTKVAVLGADTAETLFGFGNPIGESVKINGTSYRVVGVLQSVGSSMGTSGDSTIIVPLSTGQRITSTKDISSMYVKVENENAINFIKNRIAQALKLIISDEDDFSVSSQDDLMETASSINSTMSLLLIGSASISLIVGGIGILNMALVKVNAMVRPIGIMKALGAKRSTILLQFLAESILLSSIGGLIGVGVGIISSEVYSIMTNSTILLSTSSIIISFSFSVLIGLLFGVYPAFKASKLDPILALRYE